MLAVVRCVAGPWLASNTPLQARRACWYLQALLECFHQLPVGMPRGLKEEER